MSFLLLAKLEKKKQARENLAEKPTISKLQQTRINSRTFLYKISDLNVKKVFIKVYCVHWFTRVVQER